MSLTVTNIKKSYGNKEILKGISFNIPQGHIVGFLGPNGVGKSTLVKTLMGKVKALDGTYQFGYNTDVQYFDQQLAQITGEQSIFESFSSIF